MGSATDLIELRELVLPFEKLADSEAGDKGGKALVILDDSPHGVQIGVDVLLLMGSSGEEDDEDPERRERRWGCHEGAVRRWVRRASIRRSPETDFPRVRRIKIGEIVFVEITATKCSFTPNISPYPWETRNAGTGRYPNGALSSEPWIYKGSLLGHYSRFCVVSIGTIAPFAENGYTFSPEFCSSV